LLPCQIGQVGRWHEVQFCSYIEMLQSSSMSKRAQSSLAFSTAQILIPAPCREAKDSRSCCCGGCFSRASFEVATGCRSGVASATHDPDARRTRLGRYKSPRSSVKCRGYANKSCVERVLLAFYPLRKTRAVTHFYRSALLSGRACWLDYQVATLILQMAAAAKMKGKIPVYGG
jgi:hypothetical protein